jgi:hypothetical protein
MKLTWLLLYVVSMLQGVNAMHVAVVNVGVATHFGLKM